MRTARDPASDHLDSYSPTHSTEGENNLLGSPTARRHSHAPRSRWITPTRANSPLQFGRVFLCAMAGFGLPFCTLSAGEITVETVDRWIGPFESIQIPANPSPNLKIPLHDKEVSIRDILSIQFKRSRSRPVEFEVFLSDSSRVRGLLIPSDNEDRIRLQCPMFEEPLDLDIGWLRSVRRIDAGSSAAPTLSGDDLDSDRLSTREGAKLEGIMLTLTASGVTFEDNKLGELEFSWPQITQLELAALEKPPTVDTKRLRVAAVGASGSRVTGALVELSRTALQIESALLGKKSIAVNSISQLELLLGRVIPLGTRTPKRVNEGHPNITDETFERFFSWRRDRAVGPNGKALTVGDRTFRYGIGVHSRSELVFSVEPGDREFQAWIGLDKSARPERDIPDYGSVIYRVLIDGKDAFAPRPMNWKLGAQQIRVPLEGVKELTLLVEPGDGEHVLDRANWGEARILRD